MGNIFDESMISRLRRKVEEAAKNKPSGTPGKLTQMLEAVASMTPLPDNPENFRSGKPPLGSGIGSAGAAKIEDAKQSREQSRMWEDLAKMAQETGRSEFGGGELEEWRAQPRITMGEPTITNDLSEFSSNWTDPTSEAGKDTDKTLEAIGVGRDPTKQELLDKLVEKLLKKEPPPEKSTGGHGGWIG
jgi:hypothetical protein